MSLSSLISSVIRKSILIEKGKKYVKLGVQPPKGVVLHRGKRGGSYYFVEDKHLKDQGKNHELVRSRGVTEDQFKSIEEHYKSKGAESVQFIHKPNIERNAAGKKLYNIYVRHADTDQRLGDKAAKDKIRYSHPRTTPVPADAKAKTPENNEKNHETALTSQMGSLHPKIFFTKKMREMHPDAHHSAIQRGAVAAHTRYALSMKDGKPTPLSDGVTAGNIHTTAMKMHPAPMTTTDDVRSEIMDARKKIQPEPEVPTSSTKNQVASDPYQDWTSKTFKTAKEAENRIQYFQDHGYDVKDYTTEDNGKRQTHTFQVRKTPPPSEHADLPEPSGTGGNQPEPVKKPTGLKKDSDYSDPTKAEKRRAELERSGYKAEVRPKKVGKTTAYGVYWGKPSSPSQIPVKTNSVSINQDPSKKRAWLSRLHSYEPDKDLNEQYGRDFIEPSETTADQHHYKDLKDGLYESRGSNDVGESRFAIEGGQKRELSTKEYTDRLKQFPTMTRKIEQLNHAGKPKTMAPLSGKTTYYHKEWIKSMGGKFNGETKQWSVPIPEGDTEYAQLRLELARRGINLDQVHDLDTDKGAANFVDGHRARMQAQSERKRQWRTSLASTAGQGLGDRMSEGERAATERANKDADQYERNRKASATPYVDPVHKYGASLLEDHDKTYPKEEGWTRKTFRNRFDETNFREKLLRLGRTFKAHYVPDGPDSRYGLTAIYHREATPEEKSLKQKMTDNTKLKGEEYRKKLAEMGIGLPSSTA